MKFVCKFSTSKLIFSVRPPGDTFGHLAKAVEAAIFDSDIGLLNRDNDGHVTKVPVPFDISLNGKEPLRADSETLLTDLGLVSGDILYVIVDKELMTMDEEKPVKKDVDGGVGTTKSIQDELMLCCQSTHESVPRSLIREYRNIDVRSVHDALIVALHVLMSEADFVKRSADELAISAGGGIYHLGYSHVACPKFLCKLVCTSMADKILVHGLRVLGDQDSVMVAKMTIRCSTYVWHKSNFNNAEVTDVYKDLADLSKNFKSTIVVPLLQVLAECGKFVRKGLMEMPAEIQLLILEYLDVRTLVKMSTVCSQLNQLSNEHLLWKRLYFCDFAKGNVGADHKHSVIEIDWKQRYKDSHRKAMDAKVSRRRIIHTCDRDWPIRSVGSFNNLGGDFDRYPHIPGRPLRGSGQPVVSLYDMPQMDLILMRPDRRCNNVGGRVRGRLADLL